MKSHVARVLFLIAAISGCARNEEPGLSNESNGSVPHSGCYGFIRDGALLLDCGGSVKATPDLNLEGFAVSADGVWLALRLSESTKDTASGKVTNKSNLLNLQTKVEKPIGFYPHDLVASCGTVLGVDITGDSSVQRDLLSDAVLSRAPYYAFQCSMDKAVVVGRLKEGTEWRLKSGYPPQTTLSSDGFIPFAVSPSGQYVAFLQGSSTDSRTSSVCLAHSNDPPKCIATEGISPVSVSDTGEVLFARHTNQGCKYEGMWRFSPSTTESNDACLGIFRWDSQAAEPVMLQSIGRDPQWIGNPDPVIAWIESLR